MPLLAQDPIGAPQHQIFNAEYDGSDNLLYFGLAAPGTADNAQAWLIWKATWSGTSKILTKRFANGSLDYNQRWTDRAGLSYS